MNEQLVWTEIYREERDAERRVILLADVGDGRLRVRERSDGEDTYLAFGALTRVGELEFELGPASAAGNPDLREVVVRCLAEGGSLLDLMDLLDARRVMYAYVISCGSDAALRPCTTSTVSSC
ncbi:MAG: hypothetical protein IKE22_07960 [Atopobiaceae bacterium]|nr:hypothetical protein [Atopobiaceae bacterium]